MTSPLRLLASLVGRRPRLATLLVLLAVPLVAGGAIAAGGGFEDDLTVPGIESQQAQDLLEARFPAQAGTHATVVFTARDGELRPGAIDGALAAIARQPHVASVTGPFDAPGQRSEDGRTGFATVGYDRAAEDLDAGPRERLEAATGALPAGGVDVAMSGEVIDGAATGGFPIGEVVGIVLAVILLVVVLRSLRAAGNALLAAFAGIGLGFGVLLWASTLTEVPGLAPTLAGMLGLGAGIDYALLLAARQQEELRAGHAPAEAARRANATAGHSALTAAGIVLVSLAGLIVTGIPFVGRVGVAAGVVVLAAAITCIVLLPARFAASGRRPLPLRERAATPAPAAPDAPADRAPWATRRPRLALLAAAAVTLALAAPALGLELGQPDDRNLGTDATQRQAYDRLAAGFGAGVNGPLVVAVSLPADGDGAGATLERLEQRIADDPEVARVAQPQTNEAGDAAVISVTPRDGPQDDGTRALVGRLRGEMLPAALEGTGATAYVGGRTARYGDEAERIASRIPAFAAAVVGLSLLLLLAAFRSWRIAAVSALFNLASIAAAYGVVALAFQTSTGASLLGVEQLPVVPYVPLFMFAILFGLSTDYNVFLLSRVREEWGRHRDHRTAIAAASAGTRRIVTAAGAIMIVVFLGFATDPDPVIKMTGVGLASAVLVDVTLVRLLMAPAALTLMGGRLWPGRRRTARHAVAHGSAS